MSLSPSAISSPVILINERPRLDAWHLLLSSAFTPPHFFYLINSSFLSQNIISACVAIASTSYSSLIIRKNTVDKLHCAHSATSTHLSAVFLLWIHVKIICTCACVFLFFRQPRRDGARQHPSSQLCHFASWARWPHKPQICLQGNTEVAPAQRKATTWLGKMCPPRMMLVAYLCFPLDGRLDLAFSHH